MNGTIDHAAVKFVNKPYKRRKTVPVDPDIIEITPPIKSDTLKVLRKSSESLKILEISPDPVQISKKEQSDISVLNNSSAAVETFELSSNYISENLKNSIIAPAVDKSSATLKKLETSDSADRLSPFSKMLIDPENDSKGQQGPDVISLGTSSPPHSPISLPSNELIDPFITYPDFGDQKSEASPSNSISPYTNGISIYAEVNARGKVCKPQLVLYKWKLDNNTASQLLERYSYLYPSSESEASRSEGGTSNDTEIKLKEFVQDYMLQKKYKESGKAKIKKTPTLAELKLAKQKRKIQEEEQLIPPVPVSAPSSIPAHSFAKAVILSDSDEESVDEITPIVDRETSQAEVIEESSRPTTPTAVQSIKIAYEEAHRKRSIHSMPAKPSRGHSSNLQPTYTFQRHTTVVREPLPTMLQHKSHYDGIHNYITKEHDYCLYLHRPKEVAWRLHKDVAPRPSLEKRLLPREVTPAVENHATNLLLNVIPRPTYVMSEPWLFVPSIDECRHENDEYQQALGFETAMRQLLKIKDLPCSGVVQCAKCAIEFSSEWFTFMSKRLCKQCYKKEVKSRNSIIYLTNVSHIARKAHDRAKQG